MFIISIFIKPFRGFLEKNLLLRLKTTIFILKRMVQQVPIEHGNFYHIYNRGINGCNLFYNNDNYYHFLRLYELYIEPISETYAWVLMGNHFHFLLWIKEEEEILSAKSSKGSKPKSLHSYFSDLFNAYAQAINKSIGRTGSLFQHPFKRKRVNLEKYLRNLVTYIHQNPQKHGFTDDFRDYPWSSYGSILSDRPTRINRKVAFQWFDNRNNFMDVHTHLVDCTDAKWMIE